MVAVHPLDTSEETLDTLVGEGVRRALEGESVAAMARELWYSGGRQFADQLGPVGLAQKINERLSSVRQDRGNAVEVPLATDRSDGRAPSVKGHNYAADLWRKRLANPYQAADGTLRPLLTFTAGDAKYAAAVAHAHAVPLIKMRDAMELAAEYLEASKKAKTIADLPVDKQQEIGEALI